MDEAIREAARAVEALEAALRAEGFYLKHLMQHRMPDGTPYWIAGLRPERGDAYFTCAQQASPEAALLAALANGRNPRSEAPLTKREHPRDAKRPDINLDDLLEGIL